MPDRLDRKAIYHKGSGAPPPEVFDSFYLEEIDLQCSFAIRAYGEIKTRVEAGSNDKNIWAFIHMLLVFAGNAAKLVFSVRDSKPTARARAKRLRAKLNLSEISPQGLAAARNYFEHFDERMDRHLGRVNGMLINSLIRPRVEDEVVLDDGRRLKPYFLKLFQSDAFELTIFDQTINLNNLIKEVEALKQKTEKALSELQSVPPDVMP